jgi:D-beta-D-heptose 7-phosphate kinase/D-beta-D-heptose 1-phosphate adenosyltransferase
MAANVKKNFQNLEQDVQFITNNTTIKKIRFIDKKTGQHLLRADNEPKIDSWNGQLPFYHSYNDFNAVVISDYNKGFLQYAHIEGILQACKKPIFIDTKKTDLRKFDGAIIKVNFLEYNKLISTPKDENGLIVTNGANGVMYKSRHYPAKKVEVSDVCGAGDTFLAFLVYGYLESNGDMDAAIDLATKAAGESVKHRGNYAPTLSEIYE